MSELILPADQLSERVILGALLERSADPGLVFAAISPDDFSTEAFRRIAGMILEAHETGLEVSLVTIAGKLNDSRQLESVGGFTGLVSIAEGIPPLVNLESYLARVKDKAILRRAIRYHSKFIEECSMGTEPTSELLARAEKTLGELSTETSSRNDLRSALDVVLAHGGPRAFTHPEMTQTGVRSPWEGLNAKLEGGGFLPGQMITIGARPGLGKTALACQISHDTAIQYGIPTAVFSLEMSNRSIIMRLACSAAQVDSLKHSQGQSQSWERDAVARALINLTESDKLFLSTNCYTVSAMRAALLRLASRQKVGMIVVDYVQLMASNSSTRNRTEQLSEISRGLKRLSEEFEAPIVVLSQLNRDSERENRQPRSSDLRDSGSLEQDADVILMPWRLPDQSEHALDVSIDLLVTKQRNGAIGRVPLTFYRRFTKFRERIGG